MRISDWSSDVCSSDLKVKRVTKIAPPSFQVRAGAAFLLFARSVASRKQDNLDRQAAFIFIIDFHLVPLIALAIVAAMTRSEARRVGNECVSTVSSRWSPSH